MKAVDTGETRRRTRAPIFSDVMSVARVRAQAKELELQVDFTSPIPERIESDPTRLRQILLNLLGNAVKFTERGTIRVAVSCLNADPAEPQLQIECHDQGIGMTPEQLDIVFQPFSQGDGSMKRRFGGTGLGLTISRQLARKLGGDITVESESHSGSVFTVTIATGPLDDISWVADPQSQLSLRPRTPNLNLIRLTGDCRVLLAEDGPDNRKLISLFLRRAGATVECAENGRIAVDMANAAVDSGRPFDVILMDMQMPEMDGYEATRTLRTQGYRGPIIALTAHAMKGDREKCHAPGADLYLSKPVDRAQLLCSVAKCSNVMPSAIV